MTINAVRPKRGSVVHLQMDDYRPPKATGTPNAMCGASIHRNQGGDLVLVPLADAVTWTALAPSENDPRPPWRWCGPCIGHLIVRASLADFALSLALARLPTGKAHADV